MGTKGSENLWVFRACELLVCGRLVIPAELLCTHTFQLDMETAFLSLHLCHGFEYAFLIFSVALPGSHIQAGGMAKA